jgi:hypothetical protein
MDNMECGKLDAAFGPGTIPVLQVSSDGGCGGQSGGKPPATSRPSRASNRFIIYNL